MIAAGTSLLHYRVAEKIGEGGMGAVWRATDSTLGRDVAIKVLPAAFASDPERLARFEREAKMLAALNHPNIAAIYGFHEVGPSTGSGQAVRFLAMELVQGDGLDQSVSRGPMPVNDALLVASKIAEALEYAHERGIVHRDLKPANIKITPDGTVKVLDFGLAKAVGGDSTASSPASTPTVLPTVTSAGTAVGVVLGTAAYMSPEQARGKPVDKRADIWAFGVVLYEMLAGRRLFDGETVSDTIAEVLTRPVDLDTLPKSVPASLRRLLARCLERDPKTRLRDIGEARIALDDLAPGRSAGTGRAAESSISVPAPPRGAIARYLPWAIAALAILAALALALRKAPDAGGGTAGSETRFAPLTSFAGVEVPGSWSPDGSFLAYGHSAEGSVDLFVLPTAGGAPMSLFKSPYDEGPPRWSPDSKWIAFTSFKDGRAGIFLISPLGGPAQKLVDLPQREPESDAILALGTQPWSPDGRWLLFTRAREKGGASLWRIDLEGRQEKELAPPVDGQSYGQASLSPDGRRIVCTRVPAAGGKSSLWLFDLGGSTPTPTPRPLVDEEANPGQPLFSPRGDAVIFVSDRAGGDSNVWTIDLASKRIAPITLSPTRVDSPVVAKDGRLAVATFSHQTDLCLDAVDGSSQRRLTFHTHDNFAARLSPDGRRLVYMSNRTGNPEIWLLDLESGEEHRLTDNPAADAPAGWEPDGKSILFLSDRGGAFHAWTLEVEGGRIEQVGKGIAAIEGLTIGWAMWAPDGSRIGIVAPDANHQAALWTLAKDGKIAGPFLPGLREVQFCRDGRTVLYVREGKEGSGLELRAADLESGADALLYKGWVRELAVAPNGRRISFLLAESHLNLNLFTLDLVPGSRPGELPRVVGDPRVVTEGKGRWHVHNGSLSADGKLAAYTRDTDTADIFAITGALPR